MSETGKAEPPSQPPPSDALDKSASPAIDDAPQEADCVQPQDFANPTLSIIGNASRSPSYSGVSSPSREGTPPPLPPRPQLGIPAFSSRPTSSHSIARAPSRPQLVSKATTQLSVTNTQAFGNDSLDDSASQASSKPRHVLPNLPSNTTSDADDSASVKSFTPTIAGGESIIGEIMGVTEKSKQEETLLRSMGHRFEHADSQNMFPPDPDFESSFDREFEDVDDMAADGSNEGQRIHDISPRDVH